MTKTKRRLVVVSGIIVMALIIILAVLGSTSAAKTVSIPEAASGSYANQKIQVSGNVVENSFEIKDDILTFEIYDPSGNITEVLPVSYEGGVAATFGNDVTAICTGKVSDNGVLHASELVTKCPSKYENASNALTVSRMLEYGDGVYNKTIKASGTIKPGSLKAVGQGDRFVLQDNEGTESVPVEFDGALSEEVQDGSSVVITGSLSPDLKFVATNVALEG